MKDKKPAGRRPHHRPDSVSGLLAALRGADPARRRQAARALGESGDPAAVPPLADALAAEAAGAARASMILALGAIGGDLAAEILSRTEAGDQEEQEALAKARDRLSGAQSALEWRPDAVFEDVLFEVPEGLERPAGRLFVKHGFREPSAEGPRLLRLPGPVAADSITPLPRWVYGLRLPLGDAAVSDGAVSDGADPLEPLLAQAASRPVWNTHAVWPDGAAPRYRFVVEGRKINRDQHRQLLDRLRRELEPLGAIDSPSGYSFEIILSWEQNRVRLYFRPSVVNDSRFSYRHRHVSAGMNPVVAASLVRLIPWPLKGRVIDPTCGSGTVLIERGLMSPESPLLGLDISQAAIDAARVNAAAAGVGAQAEFRCGDASDPGLWAECGAVVANLPFGIRSGRDDPDLEATYRAILANASKTLIETGRVMLATSNRGAFERAIASAPGLDVLAKQRVQSGGLFVQVAVLGRRPGGQAGGRTGRRTK